MPPLKEAWSDRSVDVTTKINGYQSRPVQVGTDKTVSRARDAATGAAGSTASANDSNAVQITGAAKQLAALEQAVKALPIVDEARVAEVSQAIEEGRYHVAPERIADKLLRMNQEL
jgi:negative regulator of flagellin synthesis FlgM